MARIDCDLTTLSGWSSLSDGSHNITIVAKADGYADSKPSAAVSVGKGPAVTLINFTIAGTSYQAEEGMTWEEWVNSSYNTDGYYISDIYVLKGANQHVSTQNKDNSLFYVVSGDLIIDGSTYYVVGGSSGGGGGA